MKIKWIKRKKISQLKKNVTSETEHREGYWINLANPLGLVFRTWPPYQSTVHKARVSYHCTVKMMKKKPLNKN